MGIMAFCLTVLLTANLAVAYFWLCERALKKSVAEGSKISLLPSYKPAMPLAEPTSTGPKVQF